jgi:hypothetical protein
MTHKSQWWSQAVFLLAVGIVCCLVIGAVGTLPGYKWLAGVLALVTLVLLRVLAVVVLVPDDLERHQEREK